MTRQWIVLPLVSAVIAVALFGLAGAGWSADEILTNERVTKLVAAGVSESVIIEKIQSTPSSLSTDIESMIALRKAGVPEPVIKAILRAVWANPAGVPGPVTATPTTPPAGGALPAGAASRAVVQGVAGSYIGTPGVVGAALDRGSSPAAAAKHLLIIAVGASQTYGKGVSRADAYPAQLEAVLRRDGLDVTVKNEGINGETTADMLSRLRLTVPEGADIVILQIGSNDLRAGNETNTKANVEKMLAKLSERHIDVIIVPGAALRGRELQELADKYDAFVAPSFASIAPGEILDQHLTPTGCRMVAERLARLVTRLARVRVR